MHLTPEIISTLTGIGISAFAGIAVSIVVALFGKICPKEKTFQERIAPTAVLSARVIDKLLGRFLSPKQEAEIQEHFLITIAYWINGWCSTFMSELNVLISQKTKS